MNPRKNSGKDLTEKKDLKDLNRRNVKNIRKTIPRKKCVPVRRGDIYYADLSHATVGSEQGGIRPVLIIQNNRGNTHSPTVIAAAITSQNKRDLPTHIELKDDSYGLSKNSTIMLEQIRTIDKTRLKDKIGHLDKEMMDKVNEAIFVSFGIDIELLNHSKTGANLSENIGAEGIVQSSNIHTGKEPGKHVKTSRPGMRKHKNELTQQLTHQKKGKRRIHTHI